MESKLLVGGKNIIDHTNEQQKMLEMKRHEIAEQVNQCVFLYCIRTDNKANNSHFLHFTVRYSRKIIVSLWIMFLLLFPT